MKGQQRPRISPGIVMDPVLAADYTQLKLIFACEDCSHFSAKGPGCTLGFNHENHTRNQQMKNFQLSGRMAQCRFLEID